MAQSFTPPDIRLVVTDMDGTLLDGDGRIPDGLWPRLEQLRQRGISFVPASGRQYFTLARQFHRAAEGMVFIAENGSYVVRDGQELSSSTLGHRFVTDVVDSVRSLVADGVQIGVVVCGKQAAYVERTDTPFLAEVDKYYASLRQVRDVTQVEDDIIKLAVYDFGQAADDCPGPGAVRRHAPGGGLRTALGRHHERRHRQGHRTARPPA